MAIAHSNSDAEQPRHKSPQGQPCYARPEFTTYGFGTLAHPPLAIRSILFLFASTWQRLTSLKRATISNVVIVWMNVTSRWHHLILSRYLSKSRAPTYSSPPGTEESNRDASSLDKKGEEIVCLSTLPTSVESWQRLISSLPCLRQLNDFNYIIQLGSNESRFVAGDVRNEAHQTSFFLQPLKNGRKKTSFPKCKRCNDKFDVASCLLVSLLLSSVEPAWASSLKDDEKSLSNLEGWLVTFCSLIKIWQKKRKGKKNAIDAASREPIFKIWWNMFLHNNFYCLLWLDFRSSTTLHLPP